MGKAAKKSVKSAEKANRKTNKTLDAESSNHNGGQEIEENVSRSKATTKSAIKKRKQANETES